MQRLIGKILSNNEIANGIFDMQINCNGINESIKAGQFVHVLIDSVYLRRPISVCDVLGDDIRIIYEVRGKGTGELSKYEAGRSLDLLMPLGNGFTLDENENNIIVGGGIGVYPLLMLAKNLKNPKIILGFRDKSRVTLADEFKPLGETFCFTDNGSYGEKGLVTDILEDIINKNNSKTIYACGPMPMLKRVQEIAAKMELNSQLSMEERMGCGIGACLVCACKVKSEKGGSKYLHVCSDGPVFKGECVDFE